MKKLPYFTFRIYRGIGDSFAFVAKKKTGNRIIKRLTKESTRPDRVTVSCHRVEPTTYKKFFSK